MKFTVIIPLLLITTVQSSTLHDRIEALRDKHPDIGRLAAMFGSSFSSSNDNDEFVLSDSVDMKHYLDTIFRFWDFQGTQMGNFIDAGDLPDMEQFARQFDFVTVMERLVEELEKVKVEETSVGDDWPEPEYVDYDDDHTQVGGYEGCVRDYDSLVTPITNAIYDAVSPLPNPGTPRDLERWGWLMIDALTKIPEGLTEGKLHWMGSYELCNKIEADYNYTQRVVGRPDILEHRKFHAKYCRLDFNPQNPLLGNGSDILRLQLGICVPDTCSNENISSYLENENLVLQILLNQVLNLRIDEVYCGQVTDYDSDPDIKAAVGIIVTCFLLVVLATLYDGLLRPYVMKPYVERLPKAKPAFGRSISQITTTTDISTGSNNATVTSSQPGAVQMNGGSGGGGGSKPPMARSNSYQEVDSEERRRYSLANGNANHNNNKPALSSQISTNSMSALVEDVSAAAAIREDKATVMDRMEVAFVGFSAYSNLKRVFTTENVIENELPAIAGVRFLSWAYAMYGHSWLFGPIYNETWTTGNLLSVIRELPRKWSFQPVINFHFSADAFFVISGCLVTYWWLKKYDQVKRLSVGWFVRFYAYRYWMLVPALMLTLMTYATTYRYLGSGPMFPINVSDADNCKTNWWTDLLLVHNLVNVDKLCLTWTWYVGVLWQLHVITPLVLVPLVLYPMAGYIALAVLYVIHVGATAGVVSAIVDEEGLGSSLKSWAKDYFFTPWCRAGPYFVGIALGIILHKCQRKAKINIVLVILGWIAALVCICSVEYATYGVLKEGGERWDKGTRVMYDTFSRTSYGVGVAWIIFACVTGNGGVINSILSWKVFIPLGRIIYPSFVIHAMIIFTFVYGQYSLMYVSEGNVLYWFFGHLWMVSAVGLFYVGLLFYFPLSCGVLRAFRVETKLDCIQAGNHPELPSGVADGIVGDGAVKYAPNYNVPSVSSISGEVYENLRHRVPHAEENYHHIQRQDSQL